MTYFQGTDAEGFVFHTTDREDALSGRQYSTRNEAIQREIVEPIEAGEARADEFDIEAIADAVLGDYSDGYACTVTDDEFWVIAAAHER